MNTICLITGVAAIALGAASTLASAQESTTLNIAADILPVQALVSMVADGAHEVELIIDPLSSPHHYSLRPSEARMLANADIVFNIGDALTPWLGKTLESIAPDARSITLLPDSDQEEHEHESDHGHGSEHGDPHVWLDPDYAIEWLALIRDELADLDPVNAELFENNTAAAIASVKLSIDRIEQRAVELKKRRWLIYHDSVGPFSDRFGIQPAGVVSTVEDVPPTAAHLANIRAQISQGLVDCVLADSHASKRELAALDESQSLKIISVDPLGTSLPMNNDFYTGLLDTVADAVDACI